MADKTPANAAANPDEWETIGGSLGTEWNFERDGTLVGNFLGIVDKETNKVESGHAAAIQFAPEGDPDNVVFIWASSELSMFTGGEGSDLVRVGDRVRITFLGRDQFTGDRGPQQIKRYRVQAAKSTGTK